MIFKLEYWHDSQTVGNIPANYHFWIYFDGSIDNAVENITEEGVEDGYKNFTPTFQKSTKTHAINSVPVPDFMVDALNRVKYFNNKKITFQNGDEEEIFNVKTSVSYPFENKCFGIIKIEFDIDETVVIVGC